MHLPSIYRHTLDALRHHGIGRRLLLLIILFSSLVTLVATGVQLYTDYKRDLGLIEGRLADIESSYLASIGASLWNLDINQLHLQLDGIRHLPDVEAVSVTENTQGVSNPLSIQLGEFRQSKVITQDYAIIYEAGDEKRIIGTLKVQASLEDVFSRLRDKAIVILLSQGVKTFLVSLFILYIFYRLVTAHLATIARHLSHYDVSKPPPPLDLHRKKNHTEDELDQVVNVFNVLGQNLHQAYMHMNDVNQALIKDVIARKEAEEEVKHLNAILEERVRQRTAELEAANSELASFCYSVSHDLRAPLRRIEGFRRMLSEEPGAAESDKARHFLGRIEVGTREMAEMIDSFLSLARATQGELAVEPLDLSRMVKLIFAEIQERDPSRQVVLEVEPDVYANVDGRFFRVLLTNLLDNAWKYTSRNKTAHIRFGQGVHNGKKAYYIADDGAGFDMHYADRLFSPFSRLHKNEEFDGVGIGLATVSRIIHRHGGHIWAEASPGKGATFYFSLWERNTEREQGNNFTGRG